MHMLVFLVMATAQIFLLLTLKVRKSHFKRNDSSTWSQKESQVWEMAIFLSQKESQVWELAIFLSQKESQGWELTIFFSNWLRPDISLCCRPVSSWLLHRQLLSRKSRFRQFYPESQDWKNCSVFKTSRSKASWRRAINSLHSREAAIQEGPIDCDHRLRPSFRREIMFRLLSSCFSPRIFRFRSSSPATCLLWACRLCRLVQYA